MATVSDPPPNWGKATTCAAGMAEVFAAIGKIAEKDPKTAADLAAHLALGMIVSQMVEKEKEG
jgi:hypothetical protein